MRRRDPEVTTTRGVGELVRAALDAGADRIILGCGDTATTDGGAGMAQALGVRLLDSRGEEIGPGGHELLRLRRIDVSGRDPRLSGSSVEFLCSPTSTLCGPFAAVRVFARQKGASPDAVERLAHALEHFAEVVESSLGIDICSVPGSGACGGMGAGVVALLGGSLVERMPFLQTYFHFDDVISKADLVFTAEGTMDSTTLRDKAPYLVAQRARELDVPIVAIVGAIGEGADELASQWLDAYATALERPTGRDSAMRDAASLLARASQRAMGFIRTGAVLASRADYPSVGALRSRGGRDRRQEQVPVAPTPPDTMERS